jgi:riboflavin kinase
MLSVSRLTMLPANLPDDAIAPYATTLETGVHFGFAKVAFRNVEAVQADPEHDKVYPMVMSIGWNPFYKNQKRTAVRFRVC